MIIACDPGTAKSALVCIDYAPTTILHHVTLYNRDVGTWLQQFAMDGSVLVVEKMLHMGMPIGGEVLETVFWSGRFVELWGGLWHRIGRKAVVAHHCGSGRASDSNVRAALIERFGGKDKAIGRKASPGPLYGISGDEWSALAIALAYADEPPTIEESMVPF